MIVANSESTLRGMIGEQIVLACRAQGFEVTTGLCGNADSQDDLWSIEIRKVASPTGPAKVGGMDLPPI
jgi:hypothetical protein